MKRFLLSALCVIVGLTVTAQTNFRVISYDQAVAAAKAEQKLVFIDFMTDWCGPCKQMARDVFPQPKLGNYMNSHFVCIKLNAEKGEGKDLAKQYQVSAYPTFIIIDADKKEVGRTVGGRSAEEFEAEMERQINPEKSPERVKARYEAGERTGELVCAYASQLKVEAKEHAQRSRGGKDYAAKVDSINQLVQDYYSSLKFADRMAKDNMFVYSDYTRNYDDESAKFLVSNIDKFPADTKEDAAKSLSKLFDDSMMGYFTGYKKINPDTYARLKADIKRLNGDKDGSLACLQQFVDVYAAGDMDKYIAYVDANFDKLPNEKQQYLANMFSSLFEGCDAATRQKAARCLRNHLSNLPYNVIYFSAMEIGKLEGQGH